MNREEFLNSLESVQPGLDPREEIEQSACFVFQSGRVKAFNDEVCCDGSSGLDKSITGAVRADSLLSQLKKWKEEEIEVSQEESHLVLKGKRKKSEFVMEKEIVLPLEAVEKPKGWEKLPSDFSEAINLVYRCAGKHDQEFSRMCVHVHPKWVEAGDGYQLCRWKLKTPIKQEALVKHNAIKHVITSGALEFSETEGWIHFKNHNGLILSCRRYLEDFLDFDEWLAADKQAKPVTLPKGLVDASEKAEIFSKENSDNSNVEVELKSRKLRISGKGISGRYTEWSKMQYTGPDFSFMISPQILRDLVSRHNEATISPGKLKIQTDNYEYVACLVVPSENGKSDE